MSLSNEQMVIEIQKGNAALIGDLYSRNLPFIKRLVRRYSTKDNFEDLCQESFFAIVNAAKNWNPEYHSSFLTYARYWILSQISRYLSGSYYCFRLPSFMYIWIMQYKSAAKDLEQTLCRKPLPYEVVKKLKLSDEQADNLISLIHFVDNIVSMDAPVISPDGDSDSTLSDFIPDKNNDINNLLDDIEQNELKEVLWNIVDDLDGNAPEIIRKRYIYNQTLEECGKSLGLSTERVRVIEKSGLNKIRRSKFRKLLPYVHDYVINTALKEGGISYYKNTNTSCVERSVEKLERFQHMHI